MNNQSQSSEQMLRPNQAEFVQSFLAENAPAYQRLIAPTGSGKTIVATTITQRLVREKGAKKILFLIPSRAMAEIYRSVFEKMPFELPIEYVDMRRFRELLTKTELFASPWANVSLVIMPIDTAKTPDVFSSILGTDWDLFISDGVEYAGTRSKVIDAIINEKNFKRLLILDDPAQYLSDGESILEKHKLATTKWTLRQMQKFGFTDVLLRLTLVDYQRSKEEVEFVQSYKNLIDQTTNTKLEGEIRLRLAASSLYAAEQSLQKIRNKYAHQSTLSFLDQGDGDIGEGFIEENDHTLNKKDLEPEKVFLDIQHILDAIRRVPTDSKYDAFLSYIKSHSEGTRVLVYSAYAATTSFLSSGLKEIRDDVYHILGSSSHERVRSTLDKFQKDGGILIASSAAVAGVDLDVDELLFYDIPNSPSIMLQSISRLFIQSQDPAQGSKSAIWKVIAFRDKSKVIATEESRIKLLKRTLEEINQA